MDGAFGPIHLVGRDPLAFLSQSEELREVWIRMVTWTRFTPRSVGLVLDSLTL